MGQIISTMGKVQSNVNDVLISKGCESLLFETTEAWSAIVDQTFKLEWVRPEGTNVLLTEGGNFSLKKAFQLSATKQGAISFSPEGKLSVIVDLTTGGNIPIAKGENLRLSLNGLDSTKTWTVNAIEAPTQATQLLSFGYNLMSATDRQTKFLVSDCDVIMVQKQDKLTDIRLTYNLNGKDVQVTTDTTELDAITRQIDPVALITSAGAINTGFTDYVVMPATAINVVEVNKTEGAQYSIYYRKHI